jgi:Kdo2-lipid IVA lauroyltransferase/acyltransferase
MANQRARKAWYKRARGPWAWLIYAAVRTVFAVMQAFPVDWNLRTARLLAVIWRRLLPRHYGRAVEHLTAANGNEYSRGEIERLAGRCLESTTMFAVEAVCLPRVVNRLTLSRYIQLVHFDEVLELLIEGRGLILVTGHYGSFELPGHLLASLGFSTCAVMRPLDNAYLNEFIVSSRRTHGLELLDKKGAMLHAEDVIRDGSLLAFIGDQDAGRKGMFVSFFGRPASTYKSIGLLAMATQCPIVVGFARRLGDRARYEVGAERIIRPHEWAEQADPLRWITQEYTSAIETIVRADPSQYLWIHRRWKSQPRAGRTESAPRFEEAQR